ncbi:MAG: hypothetical protein DMF61_05185 [Blastocatellia bacterium AA13]|nr:MAG: hypothetical protein DMF61_05185 [Blastocatellia bacterium AA13]
MAVRRPGKRGRSAAEDAHIPRCKHRRTSDVAESIADPNSYGFRKDRSTADAIGQCFIALGKKRSPQWILEGDIKACFNQISP